MKLPLDIPKGFLNLSPLLRSEITNGAGAKDGIKVPNTLWGLNCREVFDYHDFDYWIEEDDEGKRKADRRMIVNLIITIVNRGGWLMTPRLYRAMTYFIAVAKFGKKAFYAGKEVNS